MPIEINEEEIVRYYDDCEIDYQIVWNLNNTMSMHYGYWDETTKNLDAALTNMNTKLSELGRITKDDYVLDAGCGVGGSSIFMARNIGCKTLGITLAEKQVQKATENAANYGVSDQCTFEKQSYLETSFPDNTFDVVWGIESVCYAYDKIDFLKEAFRVLKPGGRVVVADFFTTPYAPGSEDDQLMKKWTDAWAIKAYAGVQEFWDKMQLAGFVNNEQRDISDNIERSIKKLYFSFFPGVLATTVSELIGLRNKVQTANTWSTYYQYKAFKKGLWRYMMYYGEKPR